MNVLLAIDIGNTHTTVGLFRDARLSSTWRLSTRVPRTGDEIAIFLRGLLEPERVKLEHCPTAIASVVPELTHIYVEMFRSFSTLEPLVITSESVRGIRIAYSPASAVGADRLCGAVAGFRQWGGPLIIVDMGTATVFDVLDKSGTYLGGLIAPGILTAVESLHRSAALLPAVDLRFPHNVVGNSTESAIQSGVLYGALEMIDGVVGRIQRELPERAEVIGTGGFAALLQGQSRTVQRVEADLVLQGIRLIAEEQ